MTEFITVADLRSDLATTLSAELGTYENGLARIWVYPPQPPSGNSEGIECLIQRQPEGSFRGSSGNQVKDFREWFIRLVNYSSDGSLSAAIDKIKARYTLRSPPVYIPPTAETFEQYTFRIFDPILINRGS